MLEVNYLYYANGWLKEVQENSTSIAEYTYDEVGNRTRVDLHNGTYTTYDYSGTDPRYFLDEIGHYGSDDELLMDYPIAYDTRDDSGNPNVIADWDDPGGRAYTYDANNRLSSAAGTSYGYDWVGNRLNPPANPSPMVYDATNKLVLWPGMQSFTYHPTGSLREQWNAAGTVLNKIHSYNGAELLEEVVHGDDAQTDPKSLMEWDGDSNRVSLTSSTAPTTPLQFVYDTTAGIPAVIEEDTTSGSVYYVREPGGQLIARTAGETTSYYHFDELGSTRLLTNGSGTVTDTYTYDAWGKQTASTGSTAQPYRYVGELGYYSHYQDTNLFSQNGYQILQLGVRFYDALAARFTQADPIHDGRNWYVYVDANPCRYVDPDGMLKRFEYPVTATRSKCTGWMKAVDLRGVLEELIAKGKVAKWIKYLIPDWNLNLWCYMCHTDEHTITYLVEYEPGPCGEPDYIISRKKIAEGWHLHTIDSIVCKIGGKDAPPKDAPKKNPPKKR